MNILWIVRDIYIGKILIMNTNEIIKLSKHLSFLLRHDKNYNFDKNGWREIQDLVKNHHFTIDIINYIVEHDEKQRYEFNSNKTKIRARQGHSIDVDVELKEEKPPAILYHGTATKFLSSIYKEGIKKCNRKYVHLSINEDIALSVGKRHGNPFIIRINTQQMYEDGIKFYLSNNNVWLTDYVDKKYFLN